MENSTPNEHLLSVPADTKHSNKFTMKSNFGESSLDSLKLGKKSKSGQLGKKLGGQATEHHLLKSDEQINFSALAISVPFFLIRSILCQNPCLVSLKTMMSRF